MIDRRVYIFGLFCVFCAPELSLAQSGPSAEFLKFSTALKQSLTSEQGDDAVRQGSNLLTAVFAEIKAKPPLSFEPTPAGKILQPTAPPAHLADLLPLLNSIEISVAQNNLIMARDQASALQTAIGNYVKAHRPAPSAVLAQLEQKTSGVSAYQRYLSLPRLASAAFNAGDLAKADAYATELLAANERYRNAGNTGEAVFYGNLIKGRLDLAHGDQAGAITYLLAAGRSTGSPSLNSFGPNMALARDLLLKGQSSAVLAYLNLCGAFWKDDHGVLDDWKNVIQAGKMPNFGPNLNY